jgi:mevalonate pyrophosphate decarboxylase
MLDVQLQVEKHIVEIDAIKAMLVSNAEAQNKSTEAMQGLTTQLSVYCERSEHSKEKITEIKVDINKIQDVTHRQGLDIAAMKPTVNALRGIMWKITGATIIGGGGLAALIVGFIKSISGS